VVRPEVFVESRGTQEEEQFQSRVGVSRVGYMYLDSAVDWDGGTSNAAFHSVAGHKDCSLLKHATYRKLEWTMNLADLIRYTQNIKQRHHCFGPGLHYVLKTRPCRQMSPDTWHFNTMGEPWKLDDPRDVCLLLL
jgi:hypothetical protein